MSLKWINAGHNGEDYRKEAGENLEKALDGSRTDGRIAFVVAAVVLVAGVIAANHYQISPSLMISITIALSTMCLIGVINARTTTIEGNILCVAGAIEWFGNKHLEQLIDLKNGT